MADGGKAPGPEFVPNTSEAIAKPYELTHPFGPEQVANTDEMLGYLFNAMKEIEIQVDRVEEEVEAIEPSSSVISQVQLNLTEAQMESLATTPQILVPAVVGKIHIIQSVASLIVVSSVYSNTPNLQIRYDGFATDLVQAAAPGFNAVDTQKLFMKEAVATLAVIRSSTFDVTNKNIMISLSADLTGTGVGSMRTYCTYYSIDSLL